MLSLRYPRFVVGEVRIIESEFELKLDFDSNTICLLRGPTEAQLKKL